MSPTCEVAVIPAAGRGTRMQPATHAIPKALLPIVDRPSVQYVVEEAIDAGAREVILVVDPEGGDLIRSHFEAVDLAVNDDEVCIRTVDQSEPLGLGHAIGCARPLTGDRPFMCLLADNVLRPGSEIMAPLLDVFDATSVVALNEVDDEGATLYGIVSVEAELSPNVFRLRGAVEKPGPHAAPSRLGLIGRYVFTSGVFDILDGLETGHGGEVQLTDAIDQLAKSDGCIGVVTGSSLLDTGRPIGMLEASAVVGMADGELRDDFLTVVDQERTVR